MRGIVARQQNLRETGCHWLRAGVTRFPENGLSKKARALEIIKIKSIQFEIPAKWQSKLKYKNIAQISSQLENPLVFS